MSRPRSIQELNAEATIKDGIQDYSFSMWCNSAKNLLSQVQIPLLIILERRGHKRWK
jgi:hypothetical protein